MPNVDWKSLEGKPWKLNVGSTMQEALQSKDNSTLHLTTDGQIVMNGVAFCNSSIRETRISESDFKVCVRKPIPLHPRKGMKYFFDDGIIRFKIRKWELSPYNTITIPNDGNKYYLYHNVLETKVLQGGTVISGANYEQYKDYLKGDTLIISRETSSPKLVTITRERKNLSDNCLSDGCIRVIGKPDSVFNFEGRRRYTKVVNSKYFYALPVPELKAGSDPYSEENKKIYAVFRLKKKRFRYYGENKDGKVLVDDKKNVLYSPNKRKTGYRICRTYAKPKGVVYICRYKTKYNTVGSGLKYHKRIEYGPLMRYFIDEHYKIKKRI